MPHASRFKNRLHRGELSLAGIEQELSIRAQHNRQVVGVDMELVDTGSGAGICVRIQHAGWVAAMGKKALEAQQVATALVPDDESAAPAFQETHAA